MPQIDRLTKKYKERKKDLNYANHEWMQIQKVTLEHYPCVKWNMQLRVLSVYRPGLHPVLTAFQTIHLS